MQTIVRFFAVAVAAALPNLAGSEEVTATFLDGTSIVGELRAWDGENVILVRAEEEVQIPTERLVSLRWQALSPSEANGQIEGGLVELIDGSKLPVYGFQADKTMATVEIESLPEAAKRRLRIPLPQVEAVCLQRFEPAVELQWEEIQSQISTSDALVTLTPDRKSLDPIEGVIGSITATKIEFEHAGLARHVNRAKVAGWIYFRNRPSPQSEPRCILKGRTGLRAAAAAVRLNGNSLDITTIGGLKFEWPLSDIQLADFSAGKLVYLSDLNPALERWTPLVGFSAAAQSAANYGKIRLDQSAFGGPLTLPLDGASASASDVMPFSKGLAIRSRTELIYRLPPGFEQFVALAGIEPATRSTGNVQLSIYGDDRSLLELDISGDEAPREIKLGIAAVKRLKIVVDYGENLDTGDWLNLCEPRLIK